MTNNKYKAHTEPLVRKLNLLKVNDIIDVQRLKIWYISENNKLPNNSRDMLKYNHEMHDIENRNHDRLPLDPTQTSGVNIDLRRHISELLQNFP